MPSGDPKGQQQEVCFHPLTTISANHHIYGWTVQVRIHYSFSSFTTTNKKSQGCRYHDHRVKVLLFKSERVMRMVADVLPYPIPMTFS